MKKKIPKTPSARALRKICEKTDEISSIWSGFGSELSETDVLGSYTGNPKKKTEQPTQDADDL